MAGVIYFEDNFGPKSNVFGEELIQEIDGIKSIFFIEIVYPFVLKDRLDVLEHVLQQLPIQRQVLGVHLKAGGLREERDLTEKGLASGIGFLEPEVQLDQLTQTHRVLTVILIFGDVDEHIQTIFQVLAS